MKIGIRLGRILKEESAQALVLGAICMALLMGAMALAVDVGYMQYQQAQLQTAADAAAIAAGLEISNCASQGVAACGNMQTAAEHALTEDGITSASVTPTLNCATSNSQQQLTMMINVGPCAQAGDPNSGNANMAEVVLTEPQNTFFGAIFGIRTFNLVARAEAGDANIMKPAASFCVWTGSTSFNGNVTIDLTNCGWYDNGNFSPNSGDNVTATSFQYLGTWENPSNCGSSCKWNLGNSETQPVPTTNAQADPLKNLQAPSQPAASSSASNTTPTGTTTFYPGYFGSTINMNSNVTVNLTPGLYYFSPSASINVGASATLECTTCTSGAGVTLYFAGNSNGGGGTLQMNSSSNVILNAPATGATSNGDVANMLVWQAGPTTNPSSPGNTSYMNIDASSTSVFNGIIYLPAAELQVNSGPNMKATALDVQSILVDGNFTITGNNLFGAGGSGGTTPGAFALVE